MHPPPQHFKRTHTYTPTPLPPPQVFYNNVLSLPLVLALMVSQGELGKVRAGRGRGWLWRGCPAGRSA